MKLVSLIQCCVIFASFVIENAAFSSPASAVGDRVASIGAGCRAFAGASKSIFSNNIPKNSPRKMAVDDDDDKIVNVNLINDVDAFTLTAVGFALIAFNFLVLANMGDAGISGAVARVMNKFSN